MAQSTQLQTVQNPAAVASLFVSAQSCCDCLTQRIQAIWEAFCAYLASWISWGFSFISDTSAKAVIAEPVNPAPTTTFSTEVAFAKLSSVQRDPVDNSQLVADYEKFVEELTSGPNDQAIRSALIDSLTQAKKGQASLEEQVACIRKIVQENDLIFWGATGWVNEANKWQSNLNFIALILKLGGDPKRQVKFGIHDHFTPLAVAVITESFHAYKALREAGADPSVRLGRNGEGENCYQLARRLSEQPYHESGGPGFKKFVQEAGFDQLAKADLERPGKLSLFPRIYRGNRAGFGHGLEAIVAFEENHSRPALVCQILHGVLSRPLALIIAEYAKSSNVTS